jgi:hypothetical protein
VEKLAHFNRVLIPERITDEKGAGIKVYFEGPTTSATSVKPSMHPCFFSHIFLIAEIPGHSRYREPCPIDAPPFEGVLSASLHQQAH